MNKEKIITNIIDGYINFQEKHYNYIGIKAHEIHIDKALCILIGEYRSVIMELLESIVMDIDNKKISVEDGYFVFHKSFRSSEVTDSFHDMVIWNLMIGSRLFPAHFQYHIGHPEFKDGIFYDLC